MTSPDSETPSSSSGFQAPAAARPPRWAGARRAGRWALWLLLAVYFLFGLTVLALRHFVLPEVEHHKPRIEALLSRSLGLPVTIGHIDAGWAGLRPALTLAGLQVLDRERRPALHLAQVETEVAWRSLLVLGLRLHRLELVSPELDIRREADGRIYVAGLPVRTEGPDQGGFADWLLDQHEIVIRDARVRWTDLQRPAPPLELQALNFRLENAGSHHRFGLTARLPEALASGLDVRGDFRGRKLDHPEQWHGQAYASVERADLAVWRQWLDYPFQVQGGQGGLRLWLEIADQRVAAVTADLALRDVKARLGRNLPLLDMDAMSGRLTLRRPPGALELAAYKLALTTRDGVKLEPSDFFLRWREPAGGQPGRGELTASVVNVGALARLSDFLPLDPASRRTVASFQPRGHLRGTRLTWSGDSEKLAAYSLQSRFDDIGVEPVGVYPGLSGISGTVEGNERGGKLTLASRNASLELPSVFAEPRLELAEFAADAAWAVTGGDVEVTLKSARFDNKDAAGTASGRFRTRAGSGSPGEIDLDAALSRAEAGAVWRYMPLVVNPQVRDWLRNSLTGGQAHDTRLKLKGDLYDFPFADGKRGTFLVTGRFSGASLGFAPGWPELQALEGDLRFEGVRMLIRGHKGNAFGVGVSNVEAEIANLGGHDALLAIKGQAAGPAADMLRYVNASPVAGWIGGATQQMSTTGSASLNLKLGIPLARARDTQVEGTARISGARLVPAPGAPALHDAQARLEFTERSFHVRQASATVLGAPAQFSGELRPDGSVVFSGQGTADVASLRQHLELPILGHASGSSAWTGTVTAHRQGVDVAVHSNLVGISSSLPAPLNKTAGEAVPLTVEVGPTAESARGPAPRAGSHRDSLRVAIGRGFHLHLVRLHEGEASQVERGVIGLGETPAMPERGVLLGGNLSRVDWDDWRLRLFGEGSPGGEGGGAGLPIAALNFKAGELVAFGQRLTDFAITGRHTQGVWNAQIASKELAGRVVWRGSGQGRLVARLGHLDLTDVRPTTEPLHKPATDAVTELPGLDVEVQNFSLRGRQLGRLELAAVNQADLWRIEKLALSNPDGRLTADGQWRTGRDSETTLDFRLEADSAGRLLERLGYGEAVRRGTATLAGHLSWKGPPTSLDGASLSGEMRLDAASGQFAKLDPGAGRLLGVLSLQSLPRRITLDFRDIFSEGFAYDSISGNLKLDRGVIRSDNLEIRGPAARVAMSGEANLVRETQNLKVRVHPAIGETLSVGVLIANPHIGIAAYLANKLLREPLDKFFSFQYAVSGSWADPKVEKIETPRAPAPPAGLPQP